jgi:hypothetical protein
MELARAWFRTGRLGAPRELRAALDADACLASLQFTDGDAEKVTSLPESGEGRNHDLLLRGTLNNGPVIVAIEAKADEPFGNGVTVLRYWTKAIARRAAGESTGIPQRIEALLEIVSGTRTHPASSPWQDVPYQLLAAVAGLHIEATRESATTSAVLIVHEFRSDALDRQKLEANRKAFDRLISVLLGETVATTPGRIYGPVLVNACRFWVGKVTSNV